MPDPNEWFYKGPNLQVGDRVREANDPLSGPVSVVTSIAPNSPLTQAVYLDSGKSWRYSYELVRATD
jgi:hypothetical protein